MNSDIAETLARTHRFELNDFLIGLYKNASIWTLITRENTHFMNGNGLKRIENKKLADAMDNHYYHHGKSSVTTEISIDNANKIWIANTATAFSIENLFLLITQE